MRILLLSVIPLFSVSSCALTHGWAKLELPGGKLEPVMYCRFYLSKDDDIEEVCFTVGEVEAAQGKKHVEDNGI